MNGFTLFFFLCYFCLMKKISTGKKQEINYSTDYVWICILFISFLLIIQVLFVFDNLNYFFILLTLIPFLLFLLFIKIFQKFNKNNTLKILIKVIVSLFSILFLFFLEIGILFDMPFTTTEPSIKQYKNSIKKLQSLYSKNDLSYFPDKIPQDITNYYFRIGTAFDGYNNYYLRFNTNKEFLNTLIDKHKNDFYIVGTLKELNDKGLNIDVYEINDNCTIYLLKNRSKGNCQNCKYGFAVNEIDKAVYYFFQNF